AQPDRENDDHQTREEGGPPGSIREELLSDAQVQSPVWGWKLYSKSEVAETRCGENCISGTQGKDDWYGYQDVVSNVDPHYRPRFCAYTSCGLDIGLLSY